jgi:hypothetical protein
MKPSGFKPMRGKSLTMKIGPAKPMPKPAKPLSKTAAAPAKPAKYGIAAPVTPGKLARSPEKDDVLMARRGPDIIRTTVRERTTPAKKGK